METKHIALESTQPSLTKSGPPIGRQFTLPNQNKSLSDAPETTLNTGGHYSEDAETTSGPTLEPDSSLKKECEPSHKGNLDDCQHRHTSVLAIALAENFSVGSKRESWLSGLGVAVADSVVMVTGRVHTLGRGERKRKGVGATKAIVDVEEENAGCCGVGEGLLNRGGDSELESASWRGLRFAAAHLKR